MKHWQQRIYNAQKDNEPLMKLNFFEFCFCRAVSNTPRGTKGGGESGILFINPA
jgi:hypothetical protein